MFARRRFRAAILASQRVPKSYWIWLTTIRSLRLTPPTSTICGTTLGTIRRSGLVSKSAFGPRTLHSEGTPVKGIRIKVLNSAAPAPAVTLADTYDD